MNKNHKFCIKYIFFYNNVIFFVKSVLVKLKDFRVDNLLFLPVLLPPSPFPQSYYRAYNTLEPFPLTPLLVNISPSLML